ncbi:hypothetical protein PInf_005255 [Phytophthora infestans]|nr:hypothetical protein PInf_005255 [Phytophthora infestans]
MTAAEKTVLITGATRGLGLTFAKHYMKAGWKVIGTARNPATSRRYRPLQLDTYNEASITQMAKDLDGVPIDLLINNAGIVEPGSYATATKEHFMRHFEINSLGPFLTTRALHDNLKLAADAHGLAIVASVTSILGSIELPNGEMYGYRASKSALNMIHANMAMDLKKDKIAAVVLQPGYVKTDINYGNGAVDPEMSIAGMTKILSEVTLEDTSKFFDFQGPELPCASIETLANGAIAAGCLQAVMSMVHPELVKFVAFQKERVARSDAERPAGASQRETNTLETANLSPEQQTDLSFQLKYLRQHWHSHLRYYGLDSELPGVVQRALMYRNKVSHQSQMTLDQYEAAIATFQKLADIIEWKQAGYKDQESKSGEEQILMPPAASLDQILQHEYLYDGDENEEPLWMELKLIGNDYFKEGNYTEAIEAYSQGLVVSPHQAVLYGNRARCYLKLKKFSRAREDAENALEADNYENMKYYRLLSEILMKMKDYDEAKEICDQGLS